MKISIFGLGYVGCVVAACLAEKGHNIVGVDVQKKKVELLNEGKPTIIEKGIDVLIKNNFEKGRITATTDYKKAIRSTDVSFICVGTPLGENGHLNLDSLYSVVRNIGKALKKKNTKHLIAIRSTVPPGTNEKVSREISHISGKRLNQHFFVVSNPEFLREGSAVHDFFNPPYTLIGTDSEEAFNIMKEIYSHIDAPIIKTDIKIAELIKYVNNSFHALKVTFANEIGNICKKLGVDSHELMKIFCMDDKLNISPYYLQPGFAYGGSCLPKDLKALNTLAHDNYLKLYVLSSIEESNEYQKKILIKEVLKTGKNKIGVLGIAFKANTDDLRESPIIDVLEALVGKGKEIKVFDQNVFKSHSTGINREFISKKFPHIERLMSNDLEEVIEDSEVIIISQKCKKFKMVLDYPGKIIFDLVRICDRVNYPGTYIGIAW